MTSVLGLKVGMPGGASDGFLSFTHSKIRTDLFMASIEAESF